MYLAATDIGLTLVTWPDESFEDIEDFVENRFPGHVLTREPLRVEIYKDVLFQYLENGHGDVRRLSFDLQGSDFFGTEYLKYLWRTHYNNYLMP